MRYAARIRQIEQVLTRASEIPVIVPLGPGQTPADISIERDPRRLVVFTRKHFPRAGGGVIREKGIDPLLSEKNPKTEIPDQVGIEEEIVKILTELESRGVDQGTIERIVEKELAPEQRADDLLKLSSRR